MSGTYYNEFDPFAASWLRELMRAGLIADGEIDTRSIVDVRAEDLTGFTRCHFFAGIGGWDYALQLAGWPSDRPVWTGSCPCQALSGVNIGRRGFDDRRHLWPVWLDLITKCRPPTAFGEQVASGDGPEWLARVRTDMEANEFALGAVNLAACSVAAPQKRERLWFVAVGNAESERWGKGISAFPSTASRWTPFRQSTSADARVLRGGNDPWSDGKNETGSDSKRRRIKPGAQLLGHGIPARVERCRGFGNAIVPSVGAAVIQAFLQTEQDVAA